MSAVEIDFLGVSEGNCFSEAPPPPPPLSKPLGRKRSFRDIQGVISKINPEVLKTVIASGPAAIESSSENMPFSVPSTPNLSFPAALPVYAPNFRSVWGSEMASKTTPLTIFYNGIVAVFDVTPHKAEKIIKLIEEGKSVGVESTNPKVTVCSPKDRNQLFQTLHGYHGDLPIARRKSLQTFLEKRKERLTVGSPYGLPKNKALG